MLLAELVRISRGVAGTRSRTEKIGRLAEGLRGLAPAECAAGVAILAGELPGGRIGIGYAAVRSARPERPAAVALLTVAEVDAALRSIGALSGAGSPGARLAALTELLGRATVPEQDFLRRLLLGELRQGALEGVLVAAIARAAAVPVAAVRRAAMLSGDLRAAAVAALENGVDGLAAFRLELFRPVQPMLAQPAAGVADALGRLGEAQLERKLDGARIQVHREGDRVAVFTRALHDVTAAVPEVVALRAELPLRPFFFDCLHVTSCTCAPSWWWRSRSMAYSAARTIPPDWHCVSRAWCATAPTSPPPRSTRWRRCGPGSRREHEFAPGYCSCTACAFDRAKAPRQPSPVNRSHCW